MFNYIILSYICVPILLIIQLYFSYRDVDISIIKLLMWDDAIVKSVMFIVSPIVFPILVCAFIFIATFTFFNLFINHIRLKKIIASKPKRRSKKIIK
jgi:hypothetical protein